MFNMHMVEMLVAHLEKVIMLMVMPWLRELCGRHKYGTFDKVVNVDG